MNDTPGALFPPPPPPQDPASGSATHLPEFPPLPPVPEPAVTAGALPLLPPPPSLTPLPLPVPPVVEPAEVRQDPWSTWTRKTVDLPAAELPVEVAAAGADQAQSQPHAPVPWGQPHSEPAFPALPPLPDFPPAPPPPAIPETGDSFLPPPPLELLQLPVLAALPEPDLLPVPEFATSAELPPPPPSPPPFPELPAIPTAGEGDETPFLPPIPPSPHPDAAYMPKGALYPETGAVHVVDSDAFPVLPPVPSSHFSEEHFPASASSASVLPPPPPPVFHPPAFEPDVLDALLPPVPAPSLPPLPEMETEDLFARNRLDAPVGPGFPPPAAHAERDPDADSAPAPGGSLRRRRFGNRSLAFTKNEASYLGGASANARSSPAYADEEEQADVDAADLEGGGNKAAGKGKIAAGKSGRSDGKDTGKGAKGPAKRRPIFSWFSLVALYFLIFAYLGASGPLFRFVSLAIEPSGLVVERVDDVDGPLATPAYQENVEQVYAPLILLTQYIPMSRKALIDYVDWWAMYPDAIPIPSRPGFVKSPYAKFDGPIDATGLAPGTKVHCPFTNKIFLIPKP